MDSNHQRDRRVAADMARVFGTPAPADHGRGESVATVADPVVPVAAAPLPVETVAAKPDRARRWLLLAAPALAILFVAVLAVRFALTLVPATDTANAASPASARRSPSAFTAAAPAAPGEDDGEASVETLAPDDFGPAPVDDRPAVAERQARPALGTDDDTLPVPVAESARRGRRADECPPGSDADPCIYGDVIGADRRLRAAYAGATRAGVTRDDLVDVRRRWDRARAISLDEPDETIRRYGRLTEQLDELSSMARQ